MTSRPREVEGPGLLSPQPRPGRKGCGVPTGVATRHPSSHLSLQGRSLPSHRLYLLLIYGKARTPASAVIPTTLLFCSKNLSKGSPGLPAAWESCPDPRLWAPASPQRPFVLAGPCLLQMTWSSTGLHTSLAAEGGMTAARPGPGSHFRLRQEK